MTSTATIFGGRVSVVLGGVGGEREVSLRTGAAMLASLARLGIDAVRVEWPGPDFEAMVQGPPHTVLNALHGPPGEDGCLQGLLAMRGFAWSGASVAASAVTMNKALTKTVARAAGVRTPDWETRARGDRTVPTLAWPVVVKPALDGSSVGLAFVDDGDGWDAALDAAWRGQGDALIERRIRGVEVTVAVLDREVLGSLEIRPASGAYDYEAKYVRGDTRYLCPPELPQATVDALEADAARIVDALAVDGLARADFLVDADGAAWFLEVNTVPGMTERSLAPQIAEARGLSFDDLIVRMVAGARRAAWWQEEG